jgi:hypothetical protein
MILSLGVWVQLLLAQGDKTVGKKYYEMFSSGGTMVEYLLYHPKVKDQRLATVDQK